MDLLGWLEAQDPATMPYRPDARYTEGFGLRAYDTASPAHLGPDRSGTPYHILMPFHQGEASWQRLADGHPWGSFLRISPTDGFPAELHVAHTRPTDTPHAKGWSGQYSRGDKLPARAAGLGTATGPHTHTELMIAWDEEALNQLRDFASAEIITRGAINAGYLARHCRDHRLNFDTIHARLTKQIDEWGIREMTDIHAVREGWWLRYVTHRQPRWGDGPTIHIDSRWALKI